MNLKFLNMFPVAQNVKISPNSGNQLRHETYYENGLTVVKKAINDINRKNENRISQKLGSLGTR